MATVTQQLRQFYDSELGYYWNAITSVSVVRGDTLNFSFLSAEPSLAAAAITVSGFNSGVFTSTANLSLGSVGSSGSRVIRSDATIGNTTVTISAPGYPTRTLTVSVTSGVDTTPDDFTLGPGVTGANPGEERLSSTVNVTGINQAVTASVSAGQLMKNGNGQWVTSTTVSAGDRLVVRLNASASYNTTVSTTLTVGSLSRSWSITTANDPGSGEVINFPITALPVKLSDVINFFGGTGLFTPAKNLSAYLKGGAYVPNITKNAAIPTILPLKLSQFVGSGTVLYFTKYPQSRMAAISVVGSAQTLELAWAFNGPEAYNPAIGYGFIRNAVEYRWEIVEDPAFAPDGRVTGITIHPINGTASQIGNWNKFNPGITIRSSGPANSELFYSGTITVFVRSLYDITKVISKSFTYRMQYYGV